MGGMGGMSGLGGMGGLDPLTMALLSQQSGTSSDSERYWWWGPLQPDDGEPCIADGAAYWWRGGQGSSESSMAPRSNMFWTPLLGSLAPSPPISCAISDAGFPIIRLERSPPPIPF